MKKTPAGPCALALLALALLTPGCGKPGDELVGKWTGAIQKEYWPSPATYEFKPDGTETVSGDMAGHPVVYQCRYKVVTLKTMDKETVELTQTPVSETVDGVSVPPAAVQVLSQYTVDGDALTLKSTFGKGTVQGVLKKSP